MSPGCGPGRRNPQRRFESDTIPKNTYNIYKRKKLVQVRNAVGLIVYVVKTNAVKFVEVAITTLRYNVSI